MRLRKRPAYALLLLLPALPVIASALPEDSDAKQVALDDSLIAAPAMATLAPLSPNTKQEVGTEDAPVDGLDGKPKSGPFVETRPKKLANGVEELVPVATNSPTSSRKKLTKEEWAALEADGDGVMDDPNRKAPEKGTDGTGGGVSAKDRERKQKEDETGQKPEQVPDPPKEVPPLPHGEQEKLEENTPSETMSTSMRKLGAQGLEVC